jgi:hypothetical protein
VKTGCNLAESSEEGYGSKTAVLPMLLFLLMMMMMKIMIKRIFFSFGIL